MNMGEASCSDTELSDFRETLRARGFYEPRSRRFLFEFMILNVLVWGGVALALFGDSIVLRAAGLLMSVIGGLGFGTNAHTASHRAALRHVRADNFITQYGFGFMLGVAVGFWRDKHIRKHHYAPNIVGVDGDIDIAEPFTLSAAKLPSYGWKAAFQRFQWVIIPFAVFFNGFAVQKNGWKFALGQLKGPSHANESPRLDLAVVLLHYAVWLVLPCLLTDAATGLAIYGLRIGLMGYALFAAFAPAHFPSEALAATADVLELEQDYVLRQTATTINFRTGAIGSFLCAGVQPQIEHHLFPTINHAFYPQVAEIVEAFCKRHGYPYRSLSWPRAIGESFLAFYTPKLVHGTLRGVETNSFTRAEFLQQLHPSSRTPHPVTPERSSDDGLLDV